MTKPTLARLAGLILTLALAAVAATSALANSHETLQADLQPVPTNQVEGSGTATVTVSGTTLEVSIDASGIDKTDPNGLPAHAQHIHIGGNNECPTSSAATDHNGNQAISAADAGPNYGPIMVSLTTEGDTSPKSALALKRFPATPDGTESYSRSIQVSSEIADQVANGKGVIVVHGIDYGHNGDYTDLGKSDLDPSLPQEGTAPALCGKLVSSQVAMPTGGVASGGGSTSGLDHQGLFLFGAALLLAAAGGLVYQRRSSAARR